MNQNFPSFSLLGHDGKTYTLADFSGRRTVFYFYPKDDTSGCTLEAKAFTAFAPEFEKHNIGIVGISPDDQDSHCKFMEKHKVDILLLSDPEKKLIKELDLWILKNKYGKTYWGVDRSTFVVDEQGAILKMWRKVKPEGHAEAVLEYVKSL